MRCPICLWIESPSHGRNHIGYHVFDHHAGSLMAPVIEAWGKTSWHEPMPHGMKTQEELDAYFQNLGLAVPFLICPICDLVLKRSEAGAHIYNHMDEDRDDWDSEEVEMWGSASNLPGGIDNQEELDQHFRNLGVSVTPRTPAVRIAVPRDPLLSLLGPHLTAIFRNHPGAPDLRGLILQRTGIWHDPASIPNDALEAAVINAKPPAPPLPPPPPKTWSLEGSYTQSESGHCDFSQVAEYAGLVRINEAQLRDILNESETRQEAIERLERFVNENEGFEHQDTGSLVHENYETIDSNDREDWEYLNLDAVLSEFLELHPELDPDREEEAQAALLVTVPEEEEEEEEEENEASDDEDPEL